MSKHRTSYQRYSAANVPNLGKTSLGTAAAIIFSILFITFFNGAPALSLRNNPPIEGVEFYSGLSRKHVDGNIHYDMNPPVGGPHNPIPQNCGIYTHVIANKHAVHSLEHGAVWITYDPSLPKKEVAKLESLVKPYTYTLLSPYQSNLLDAPIVAVAWGVRLELQDANDPRLPRFIQTYVQGPQTPEPGERCIGGVS